jgi:hypothetical protein
MQSLRVKEDNIKINIKTTVEWEVGLFASG